MKNKKTKNIIIIVSILLVVTVAIVLYIRKKKKDKEDMSQEDTKEEPTNEIKTISMLPNIGKTENIQPNAKKPVINPTLTGKDTQKPILQNIAIGNPIPGKAV